MPERKSPGSRPAGAKATGSGRGPAATTKVSTAETGATKTGATKAGATKLGTTKPGGAKNTTRPASKGPAQKRPARKKNKSIVNQKQTPWGLIITTIAVVAFAAAVVGVVIATNKSGDAHVSKGGQAVSASDAYRHPALAAAMKISGVTYKVEGSHTHVTGDIKYDATPPVGGDHSPYWADCTGTVYPKAIANENAVHMLEHGAVWITYNKNKLSATQVKTLSKYVSGINMMAMSPYPNLKTAISLQSWGYQLFVNSPTDPRIAQFIKALKLNQATTPEYGATCSQPTFKAHPSTFGNPLADAAGGDTSGT